jgi:cytochrome c oxidase assembly protein subunit 11
MSDLISQSNKQHTKFGLWLVLVPISMVGMAYAAVPLYKIFCQVTGYGGTTQVADTGEQIVAINRDMKVRFMANTNKDIPWVFKPVQNMQTLKVGEQGLAFYEAFNPTDRTIVGTATFNVTPHKAGPYFVKIDCFCFTEQVLKAGEKVQMPVTYYIDPSIDEDKGLDEITEISLSYTFFEMKDDY